MLEALAKLLLEKSELHVAIIARVVASDAPPELSAQRATFVKNWLMGKGVESSRLEVQTPSPTAAPATEDRIELRVIEQKEPDGPPLD